MPDKKYQRVSGNIKLKSTYPTLKNGHTTISIIGDIIEKYIRQHKIQVDSENRTVNEYIKYKLFSSTEGTPRRVGTRIIDSLNSYIKNYSRSEQFTYSSVKSEIERKTQLTKSFLKEDIFETNRDAMINALISDSNKSNRNHEKFIRTQQIAISSLTKFLDIINTIDYKELKQTSKGITKDGFYKFVYRCGEIYKSVTGLKITTSKQKGKFVEFTRYIYLEIIKENAFKLDVNQHDFLRRRLVKHNLENYIINNIKYIKKVEKRYIREAEIEYTAYWLAIISLANSKDVTFSFFQGKNYPKHLFV